jgi:hypothetical protein
MKGDTISRSALIAEIKKWTTDCACIELIENEPAVDAAPEWISVKDRLPEKDGMYLTTSKYPNNENMYINCTKFCVDGSLVDEFDLGGKQNIFYDFDEDVNYYALEYITHWMPLPEPPMDGGDRND